MGCGTVCLPLQKCVTKICGSRKVAGALASDVALVILGFGINLRHSGWWLLGLQHDR